MEQPHHHYLSDIAEEISRQYDIAPPRYLAIDELILSGQITAELIDGRYQVSHAELRKAVEILGLLPHAAA